MIMRFSSLLTRFLYVAGTTCGIRHVAGRHRHFSLLHGLDAVNGMCCFPLNKAVFTGADDDDG